MKHLLKMLDLSTDEIIDILNLADQLKYELKHGIPHPHLKGKTLGMIFQKASTRTRVSFETGMYQLGGYPLFLSSNDLQIGRGEPVQDTARVLSRYLDGIMIRTFEQKEVEDLAQYGSIPIINGLTDFCHPCQVLADLMTIREFKGSFDGLKMCFIGDGNNMANSLIVGCLKVGMSVSIACPDDYPAAEGGVPLALLERDAAEGDALVQGHVVPDDGGLPDDDAGGMVDEEPLPDGGAGMDVAAGLLVGPEVYGPRFLFLSLEPELVALAVHADRAEAGVVLLGIVLVDDGGVAVHDRLEVSRIVVHLNQVPNPRALIYCFYGGRPATAGPACRRRPRYSWADQSSNPLSPFSPSGAKLTAGQGP